MKCIICGSEKKSLANQFDDYAVIECDICKYAMVDPMPDSETLDRLYNSKAYFDTHMRYNFETITDKEIDRLIKVQESFHSSMLAGIKINPSKKMLEIGPGGGFALKAFSNMGYEVTGLETSTSATAFIKGRIGLNVMNSSIEDYQPTSHGKFDLILLNHVLEHFLHPVEAMEKLAAMLHPGGVLYIRVPDHDSYDRRAYGKKWPAYAQYHISNFSERSLKILFEKQHLKIISIQKFVSTQAPNYIQQISRFPFLNIYISKKYSGRTISIIGKL